MSNSERDKERVANISADLKRILELNFDALKDIRDSKKKTLNKIGTWKLIEQKFNFEITQMSKNSFPDAVAKGIADLDEGHLTMAADAMIRHKQCVTDYLAVLWAKKHSDRTDQDKLERAQDKILQRFQDVYDTLDSIEFSLVQGRKNRIIDTSLASVPYEFKPIAQVYGQELTADEIAETERIKQELAERERGASSDVNKPIGRPRANG